jgi:hypothetical protein
MLKKIFRDAAIVLDEYHWLGRWDNILLDKKSEEAAKFRGCIRRAINVVSNDEYQSKKDALQEKLGRMPTVKEIVAEYNSTRPSEEDAIRAINAVVSFFRQADISTLASNAAAWAATNGTGTVDVDKVENSKLLFKSPAVVGKKMADQLTHVKCLIPPPDIALHYKDERGKIFKVGQSSKNELLHRNANGKVFPGTRVGVVKADQCMWTFLDQRDEMENVKRRRREKTFTKNIESKAVTNSLASDMGYELPFLNVTLPSVPQTSEQIGFDLNLDAENQGRNGAGSEPNGLNDSDDDNDEDEDI